VHNVLVGSLLILALPLAFIAHRFGVHYLIALTGIGLLEGMLVAPPHPTLTPALLSVFLPALLFEGALDLDLESLRRAWQAIVVLAVPGVLIGVVLVAIVASGGMALTSALLLGAILSATDPLAVLGLFRHLSIPRALRTIVEGESIANDGIAAALVAALLAVSSTQMAWPSFISAVAGQTLVLSLVGIACGTLIALAGALVFRLLRGVTTASAVTIAVAYGAYGLASVLGGSGIFATVAAAIALRALTPGRRLGAAHEAIDRVWNWIAVAAGAAVFFLVGINLDLLVFLRYPAGTLAIVGAVIVARALLAYLVTPLDWRIPNRLAWRHVIALSGPRGGLALALALGLPASVPDRDRVLAATVAVVFVTLLVGGTLVAPAARALGFRRAQTGA